MWVPGIVICVLVVGSAGHYVPDDLMNIDLMKIVETVNSNGSALWTAGHNFHPETPTSYLKSLLGTLELDENNPEHREFIDQMKEIKAEYEGSQEIIGEDEDSMGCKNNKGLPVNFDARKKWPHCKSIGHITDQSNCGSCWAVSVASAISDRLCIASNGFFQGQVSAENILACTLREGCLGGWPQLAWKRWGHQGFVSGGSYNSNEGCQPYSLPSCEHHTTGPLQNCTTLGKLKTPECKNTCTNKQYGATYEFDVTKGKKARMVSRCNAMRQIYEHGPLVAIFTVYEDFFQYKSGVYNHIHGKKSGLHAVRVIGWGVENEIPYWLVTNSWNGHWGDHGIFKILRGENEVNFEMGFNVGFPRFLKL